jgi:hypothetical protein
MRRARGAKTTHFIACHLKFFFASQKPQGEIHQAALVSLIQGGKFLASLYLYK